MSSEPAAITGVGAVTPLGIGADTLFEKWSQGVSGLENGVGTCKEFDSGDIVSRKEARRTERFAQLGLMAADEALTAAWGDDLPYDPRRVACVTGVAFGGMETMYRQLDVMEMRGADAVWVLTVPVAMPNALPAILAMRKGFRGETGSIATACASSAQAIGAGLRMLRADSADAVIVGGAESSLNEYGLALFRNAGALSRSGICRPFDRRRDGFVMGEGAGVLVLEHADSARQRSADVLGYVAGYASTTDGYHLTASEPSGEVCAVAIEEALKDADLKPEDVDYVNAHGTSTPDNDRSETNALKLALGQHAYKIPTSSTKSVVGHSIGAAGAVEAIATLLSLRNGVAPPTIGLEEPEEGLDLDYVPFESKPLETGNGDGPIVALSNSFAFGGHNAVLVITT
ncbi:MAG TPA: beta-ketoacyl-[acyl-carrier-protein] synthase family protein [Solirubrobacterales bacterium]